MTLTAAPYPGSPTPGTLASVTADPEDVQPVELRLDWRPAEDAGVRVANQFMVQIANGSFGPDGMYLLVGEATPPVISGEDQASRRAELARYEGKIPVTIHGRYFLTRGRMQELIALLTRQAEQHDRLLELAKEAPEDDDDDD